MEIHIRSDDRIRLTDAAPGFSIHPGDADTVSPFHLLAASLATCTYSVLHSYGQHAHIPLDGLVIDVAWELGGDPFRVTEVDMSLHWPDLPDARRPAAERAAAQCTVHRTLAHGATVRTRVEAAG